MGRRASPGRLPAWYKGQLILDDIDGSWYGSREGKLFKRRGLNVSRKNYDSLTDQERQDNIKI